MWRGQPADDRGNPRSDFSRAAYNATQDIYPKLPELGYNQTQGSASSDGASAVNFYVPEPNVITVAPKRATRARKAKTVPSSPAKPRKESIKSRMARIAKSGMSKEADENLPNKSQKKEPKGKRAKSPKKTPKSALKKAHDLSSSDSDENAPRRKSRSRKN